METSWDRSHTHTHTLNHGPGTRRPRNQQPAALEYSCLVWRLELSLSARACVRVCGPFLVPGHLRPDGAVTAASARSTHVHVEARVLLRVKSSFKSMLISLSLINQKISAKWLKTMRLNFQKGQSSDQRAETLEHARTHADTHARGLGLSASIRPSSLAPPWQQAGGGTFPIVTSGDNARVRARPHAFVNGFRAEECEDGGGRGRQPPPSSSDWR